MAIAQAKKRYSEGVWQVHGIETQLHRPTLGLHVLLLLQQRSWEHDH